MLPPVGCPGSSNPSGTITCTRSIFRSSRLARLARSARAPSVRSSGPGSEEWGSEEHLGPGEIGQFFLHGCANRLPRTAHRPLIYGGERPHSRGSDLL